MRGYLISAFATIAISLAATAPAKAQIYYPVYPQPVIQSSFYTPYTPYVSYYPRGFSYYPYTYYPFTYYSPGYYARYSNYPGIYPYYGPRYYRGRWR